MDIKHGFVLLIALFVTLHHIFNSECQSVSARSWYCYNTTTCRCCSSSLSECPSNDYCDGHCKDGYHGDKCWWRCPSGCIRCEDARYTDNVANCTLCRDSYYSTSSRYQCQNACPKHCIRCENALDGSGIGNCTICRDGYFTTPIQYQCTICPENCIRCEAPNDGSGIGSCTECRSNQYYITSNQHQCKACPDNCIRCEAALDGSDMGNCTLCKDGYYTTPTQFSCRSCPVNCIHCEPSRDGSGLEYCTTCRDGYYSTKTQFQCQQSCSWGCQRCNSYDTCSLCYPKYNLQSGYCQGGGTAAPECMATTNCPCCNPNVACPSDGVCHNNCEHGYHGEKCKNKCPRNCFTCKDAEQGEGVATCTACNDGYFSTALLFQCQLLCPDGCRSCTSKTHCTFCKVGYYMTDSYQCNTCSDGCTSCASATFCSVCKAGYYRDNGQCQSCNPRCHTCNSSFGCICSNGCSSNFCDTSTGTCSFGCKPNFQPYGNGKCEACVPRMYGIYCNKKCNENCKSTCDRLSGICGSCQPGFHGDFCDSKCPINCLNCNESIGVCQGCKDGYHGDSCSLTCKRNCRRCSMVLGICTHCANGFEGDNCNTTTKINTTAEINTTIEINTTTKNDIEMDPTNSVPQPVALNIAALATVAVVVISCIIVVLTTWMFIRRKGCFRKADDVLIMAYDAGHNRHAATDAIGSNTEEQMEEAPYASVIDDKDEPMPYETLRKLEGDDAPYTSIKDDKDEPRSYETLRKLEGDDTPYTTIKGRTDTSEKNKMYETLHQQRGEPTYTAIQY